MNHKIIITPFALSISLSTLHRYLHKAFPHEEGERLSKGSKLDFTENSEQEVSLKF